ncbi:histidinol-phosphatase HisJ family protein [Crateriforma conspicua]|uniref:Histidinol-phosphatase n=1 Tax=Crateriforma conspicua TaxID=2527996 RepID=A0A5C5Y3G1_9PLAN|nr:histidinol-phosphatase HisJ family protein [Crateriforma conspicua]QDV64780.1 Histidinol-phosphatase [Crateriforma conspicua]TWT70177.1 Histidinol-phosphatase [Crateriforma conspicua]
MPAPILYESHCHTPLCKHASGEPTEYAAQALEKNLKGLIVTCHNPMPDGFSARVRMAENELDQYIAMVDQTREEWQDRVDVRLGLEADYFQGYESYVEEQLASADFQFVLGSVHPQLDEFRDRYWQEDLREVQKTYFRLLADAAETGLFDSISHPDLIKNFTVKVWDEPNMMDIIAPSLDRIAKTGVAMELNTSGALKTIQQMNPYPDMLREIAKRNIPITLGADAHVPERVGDRFVEALNLLSECGFQQVSFFLQRRRHDVIIDDALQSLAGPADVRQAS